MKKSGDITYSSEAAATNVYGLLYNAGYLCSTHRNGDQFIISWVIPRKGYFQHFKPHEFYLGKYGCT